MTARRTPVGRSSLADPPSEVQVTILPDPHADNVRALIAQIHDRARAHLIFCLAIAVGAAVAAAGVAVAVNSIGGSAIGGAGTGDHSGAVSAHLRTPGVPAVAAVYRYPLGCLGVTMAARERASAGSHRELASPCWRYGVYVTAIFRRVRGVWGLALEAVSRSCPAVRVPAVVRAQLAVCRRLASPDS